MKDYKKYMDNLSVDETLHERIMNSLAQSANWRQTAINSFKKYMYVAACAVVLLIFATSIYPHLNIRNIRPGENDSNIPMPNATEHSNSLRNEIYAESKSGTVYHDIDVSQLIRHASAKVPFGFYFHHRLIRMAKNETGISDNNGVR